MQIEINTVALDVIYYIALSLVINHPIMLNVVKISINNVSLKNCHLWTPIQRQKEKC